MLYDPPLPGANTPFIPPLPSPEGARPVQPPTIPDGPTAGPAWAQQPMQPGSHPYHPVTPYNQTPFPPLPPVFPTPAMAPPRIDLPGSYYPAPAALPSLYPPLPPGPYAGYPDLTGTPWAPPPPVPPPQAWPPQPHTGYPTPHVPPGWGLPMMTPAMMTPAMMPWMMPPTTPYGMPQATPWHAPMPAPWVPPTNPPVPVPQMDDGHGVRWTTRVDRMDSFAEGPHYGPVLEPFLVKVVNATVKLNPLLSYASDAQTDFLIWNMVFRANNCYRTTDPSRSWTKGRKAPATYPRITHIRIISRKFPWMINIRAQDRAIGVTCEEIIDGIASFLQGDCAKREWEQLSRLRRRHVWEAYQYNRSTDPNVPGGELGESLKRLDWLGRDSKFGGLAIDDDLVKELCGDVLPCTFELRCLPRLLDDCSTINTTSTTTSTA